MYYVDIELDLNSIEQDLYMMISYVVRMYDAHIGVNPSNSTLVQDTSIFKLISVTPVLWFNSL